MEWTPSVELSKGTLGELYLTSTGLALSIVLGARAAFGGTAVDPIGSLSGVLLSLSLAYAGYWFTRSPLGGERIWRIAKTAALGITGLLVVSVGLVAADDFVRLTLRGRADVLMSNVAAGGVIGVLIGGVKELRAEQERTALLNQRNEVLNRVLRHNIRNEMNVIIGYAERLEEAVEGDPELVGVIRKTAEDIAALGEKARRIEHAVDGREDAPREPVDVVAVVERSVTALRRQHPEVDVRLSAPAAAWADAGPELRVGIDNLLENAVEHGSRDPRSQARENAVEHGSTGNHPSRDDAGGHGDGVPTIEVAVRRSAGTTGEMVAVRIEDDGPGIPEMEREALSAERETSLTHSSGLGLWLVKWLVDRYGGEFVIEDIPEGGSAVEIRLASANDPIGEREETREDRWDVPRIAD